MSASTPPATTTVVHIRGVDYRLRAVDDPEFAKRVAQVVNERMDEIARQAQVASQMQLAILTLMNVTGELLSSGGGTGGVREDWAAGQLAELAERAEAALGD